MTITVPLDWALAIGACALVGASVITATVVWFSVYTLTALGHGVVRAVRRVKKRREGNG
jgi:hypothetical protein